MELVNFAWRTLASSIKEVPATRYAFGLTGVASALAIIGFLTGNIENPVPLLGLVLIGMVVLFIFSLAVGSGFLGSIYAATILVWSIIFFFVIFLCFTVMAYGMGLPCNWARLLGTPIHTTCTDQSNTEFLKDTPAPGPGLKENQITEFSYIDSADKKTRNWTRISPDRWKEELEGKPVGFFSIGERILWADCAGNVLTKLSEPTLEILLPEKNCGVLQLSFRRKPGGDWIGLPVMSDVK